MRASSLFVTIPTTESSYEGVNVVMIHQDESRQDSNIAIQAQAFFPVRLALGVLSSFFFFGRLLPPLGR